MQCPYCAEADTKVVDKRETDSGEVTRRRRECLSCKKRFTTYERIESVMLMVVKKDGSREQFDPAKLERGIVRACEKRPIPLERIKAICAEVEGRLMKEDTVEVPSREIGRLVMGHLKKLDKVAYIRFASVYKDFKDPDEFQKELRRLTHGR